MARSILGAKPTESLASSALRDAPVNEARSHLSGAALQARLRQKRSARYVEDLTRLDAGTHTHSAQDLQAAIRAELPEVSVDALPIGIVAQCHLGAPHEVHTLECSGNIIRHYKAGEALPPPMERARSLAQHPAYAFIEVYAAKLITVTASGQTAIVEI